VLSDWNQRNDGEFTPHKSMGRPTVEPSADVAEVIRSLIKTANLSGASLSTPILRQKLGEHGYDNGGGSQHKQLGRLPHFIAINTTRERRRRVSTPVEMQ
jgi:hypothetical protein